MAYTADQHAQATLSGRELALKRRQAMALHGKAGIVKTSAAAAASRPRPAGVSTAQNSTPKAFNPTLTQAAASFAPAAALVTPAAAISPARARRQALSQNGKAGLQKTAAVSRPSAHLRPQRAAMAAQVQAVRADAGCGCGPAAPAAKGDCGCGCAPAADASATFVSRPAGDSMLAPRKAAAASGRALAKARRAALAQDGKTGLRRVAQAAKIASALPGQDWESAMNKGATGRQVAMQRRHVQSLVGRTGANANAETARPSGRMKARDLKPAPPKVDEGHTLSGQKVTGTQVERKQRVTGNEPGSCRNVTGTEYVGQEQFGSVCKTDRPKPNPAKVGVSTTLREQRVTGTEVGRSKRTTGDESGACRNVTGTEYLSSERFGEFCGSKPKAGFEKVTRTLTEKGRPVSGMIVDRPGKVTGGEQGSDRAITGTRYAGKQADTAPEKVVVSHTVSGKAVTGTGTDIGDRMTGAEAGACRPVTGVQYLSNEHFQSVCGTSPDGAPRKVSVMSSRDEQTVTGTDVGRSERVTGNEPGSCRSITGNQYFNAKDFGGVCEANGPRKVSSMQTLSGRSVTGSEVAPSPKLSGDESYGCSPVTGVDYVSTQQLAQVCAAPAAVSPVAKGLVDQTWRGQTVTGSYAGRSSLVTGNEAGGCAPISGTPYIGAGQYQGFCPAPAAQAQSKVQRDSATVSLRAITGDRPGAGGSVMTGDERGACGAVTGTPYVGVDNMPGTCATQPGPSGRFVPRGRAAEAPAREPGPAAFSVLTPGHASLGRDRGNAVTGTGMGVERITGSINKAQGLITGTPEFRKQDLVRHQALAQANQQALAERAAQRLSGEGSQTGTRISGDAWGESSRVTGTEGTSSLVRNPSQRGQPRGTGRDATVYRELERPEVPASRITGSSGNTESGATVTLSGGARG